MWIGSNPFLLSSSSTVVIGMVYERISNKMRFDCCKIEKYKKECAHRVYEKARCHTPCIDFVDSTVRPVCQPTNYQRQSHNGHKLVHAIKFQKMVLVTASSSHSLVLSREATVAYRCSSKAALLKNGTEHSRSLHLQRPSLSCQALPSPTIPRQQPLRQAAWVQYT